MPDQKAGNPDHNRRAQEPTDFDPEDPLAEPFAYRDTDDRLPNEALRSELETMSEDEREAYLRHLEELSKVYLGPGGP